LEGSLSILHQKAIRGKGVSQYHARKDELEALKEKHASGRPESVRTVVQIGQQQTALHDGRLICRIEKAAFHYPNAEAPIFEDVSLEMRTGSHIILLGRNGAGKSTFLKTLMKKLPLTNGSVSWVDDTKIAYFDQHAELDPKKSALETVAEALKVDDQTAYKALGAMKFARERMGTQVGNLSGGERMRIRFAMVFGASPTFILLDEPTNHLDEITWEILLEAVNDSPSTILLVTHDYQFIEGVKEKIFWLMHKGTIAERSKSLEQLVKEIS
jgi:ATP-binding cassette subfamily F protein 3